MGRVIATDIQEEMLKALKERIAREASLNVEPVLATENDPRLPEGAVDLVLMVDVYHELSQPAPTAAAVLRSLRPRSERAPAGRVVLVEERGAHGRRRPCGAASALDPSARRREGSCSSSTAARTRRCRSSRFTA